MTVQAIVEAIHTLDGVELASHRFGGTEFQLAGREIGHIHRNGLVDIPFHPAIKAQLLVEQRASDHHILPDSGWISFHVRGAADIPNAVWLLQLAYIHTLLSLRRQKRAPQHIDPDTFITQLHLSQEMQSTLNALHTSGG